MDLIDIIEEKSHFSYDFLTWLWFKSDSEGGIVIGNSNVLIDVCAPMTIADDKGEKIIVASKSENFNMQEVYTALHSGKKIVKAKVTLATDDITCNFTLDAKNCLFSGMKLGWSGQKPGDDTEDDTAGLLLDRFGQLHESTTLFGKLIESYTQHRLSADAVSETQKFSEWIEERLTM